MPTSPTFTDILTAAVADLVENGFTDAERVVRWQEALRKAAEASILPLKQMEDMLRESLRAIYARMIERGGLLRYHSGVARYTVEKLKPAMRVELQKRILASADLIRLNRTQEITRTLRRFSGWASSIPAGGTEVAKRRETKEEIRKPIASLPFVERRVLIDQGHKFISSLNSIVAEDGDAIAGRWHDHHRQAGYDYRPEHKERDGKVYLIRDSWAHKAGFVKPGPAGYTDEITAPAEEVNCLPGDSNIQFFDDAEKLYRRHYSGVIFTVFTSAGSVFRATPNHPVMTLDGWTAVGSLHEGDDLVEIADERCKIPELDAYHGVTSFSDLFDAVRKVAFSVEARNGMVVDFHGDGTSEDIDIVTLAWPLALDFNAVLSKVCSQLRFSFANFLLSTVGVIYERLNRFFPTSYRSMSLIGSSGAVRFDNLLDASSSFGMDYFHDRRGRHVEGDRDGSTGFASSVASNDIRIVEPHANARTKVDKSFLVPVPEHHRGNAKGLSDFIEGLPLGAQTTRVVKIERNHFSGHVYNLQAASGWFAVSRIIVSNCRCFYTFLYNLRSLPDAMLTDKGRLELARVRTAA